MTDSSDDQDKLQYIKKDLLMPASRPWHRQNDDEKSNGDDSNHLFMSEPSMSEVDEESADQRMRLLSPGNESMGENEEDINGMRPPPPPARMLLPAPASPGNTSLSSWESPHLTRRIQVHFSPDKSSNSIPADDAHLNYHHTHNSSGQHQRSSPSPSREPFDGSAPRALLQPPLPKYALDNGGRKTPDRGFGSDNQQSSNSTSPVSEGHRRRLEDFLHDLRVKSQGQLEQSAVGTNTSFESSFQGTPQTRPIDILRPKPGMNNPQRNTATMQDGSGRNPAAFHHERVASMDTAVVQNTSLLGARTQDTHGKPTDDTIVMILSASEDDEDTKGTPTTTSSRPLDWEQQHSADDEKTADARPRRIRGKPTPGHRRQRSGDAAAATLSTGRTAWKGMDKDNIPLPPVPGDDTDFDDDQSNQRKPPANMFASRSGSGGGGEEEQCAGISSDQDHGYSNRNPSYDMAGMNHHMTSGAAFMPQSRADNKRNEIAQFSQFALGVAGGPSEPPPSRQRQGRRSFRRDFRSRKKLGLTIDSDSSSLASNGPVGPSPPAMGFVSSSLPYAFRPTGSFQGYSSSPVWATHQTRHSFSNPPTGIYPSDYSEDSPISQKPYWSPQFNLSMRETTKKPYYYSAQFTNSNSERETGERYVRETIESPSYNGSMGSAFSWLSGKGEGQSNIGGIGSKLRPAGAMESELSPLCDTNKHLENIAKQEAEDEGSYNFYSDDSSDDSAEISRKESGTNFQVPPPAPVEKDPFLKVLENSPFANIGKVSEKVDRRRFLPQTSAVGEDEKGHQMYICPRCKTKQREFFTVQDAPRQFESASGYLALYFGIYVVVALYIFGLQEGWGKLDCIYFAVLTLTTAGLGDFVPTSDGAKVMCSIFIYFGVACIGLLLGSYIAGMLDDTASRAAKANRLKSCPNCTRIQNIRDAAERRRGGRRNRMKKFTTNRNGPWSLHHNESDNNLYERDSKKVKRDHISPQNSTRHTIAPIPGQCASFERNPEISPGAGSYTSDRESHINNAHNSPAFTFKKTAQTMGSPMTTQIIRRQLHTRHSSLDLNASASFNTLYTQRGQGDRRRYSGELPTTIDEHRMHVGEAPPPPSSLRNGQIDYDDDEDYDSFDSDSTSSSCSEDTIAALDNQYSGVKNAKYVFLTLKEALLNSLVIIAFGCMGFYFIEGFSVIDSWYFTTVLLTTVGYGDIVPYTKGGKLFATVYILVAGTILLNNMSMISMIPLELRRRRTERAVLTQFGDQLDDAALRELATGPLIQRLHLSSHHPGGLDECTREMFSLAMLVRLGKVTEQDIKLTFGAFKKLDVHNDGVLNSKSIIAGMIQRRRMSSVLNLNRLAEQQQQQQAQVERGASQNSRPSFSQHAFNQSYGSWFYNSEGVTQSESSSLFSGQRQHYGSYNQGHPDANKALSERVTTS